jgi:glycosyltransferase involved in cell wall biosynthesis
MVQQIPENGVDLALWHPVPERPEADGLAGPHFVFLGRFVDWKALGLLIEAFARARRRTDARLDLIGDGPERERLERIIAQHGLDEWVNLTGWLSQSEAAERLRNADALLLPSLRECGGAVVLEAMACGLPVVATDWGGPSEYLDDSCGILVPPTSPESLISGFEDAIVRLASSRALRRSLGESGREKVERLYDWEAKVDSILEVYVEAIRRSRQAS